jgi:hypothetical protein
MDKVFRMSTDQRYAFTLIGLLVVIVLQATAAPIQLGPPDPGAESGPNDWYYGTSGAAWVSVDDTDSVAGEYDFTIGNKIVGHENRADWRSHIFPLGPAANGARPITFSFAYKFPDKINGRENMQIFLRFFDAAGTNFFGQKIFRVGFHTSDSKMVNYRTMTITDILAPRKARTADVWITANIWEPWTSGVGRFDDFSVTTVSQLGRTVLLIFGSSVAMLIIITIAATKSRRKHSGNGSYYLHRKG